MFTYFRLKAVRPIGMCILLENSERRDIADAFEQILLFLRLLLLIAVRLLFDCTVDSIAV